MTTQAQLIERPAADIVVEPQASSISPMVQLVTEGKMTTENLSELLKIQKDYEANEAFKQYNIAMAQFRQDAPVLKRDKKVGFQARNGGASTSFSHTTLGYTVAEVNPVLGENGLNYGWNIDDLTDPAKITVTCKLTHRNGHSESVTMWGALDATGNKNPLQAKKSTVSYLERTTLFAILGLASAEDDDDGASAATGVPAGKQPISKGQVANIEKKIKEYGADHDAILTYVKNAFSITDFKEIPADQFHAVQAEIKRSVAQ